MTTVETKVCAACGRELPASAFYARSASKDGLQANCKECKNKYSKHYLRKYRAEHAYNQTDLDEAYKRGWRDCMAALKKRMEERNGR